MAKGTQPAAELHLELAERGRRDVQEAASTARSRTTVYVIDDHPIVRAALARAIADEPDLAFVGEAGTAVEALREVVATQPDVVLLDLNIPDRDGIELLVTLRALLSKAKLLVVSGYDDAFRVVEALRAGAQGYLVKTAPLEEVIDGIRRVAAGGATLSARIVGGVMEATRNPTSARGIGALTTRERQVLRMLAAGVSTRETAARLTISPKTVETHRIHIYSKLGCKGVVDLTRTAMRAGLIEA